MKNKLHTSCPVSGSKILKPLPGYEKHNLLKSEPLGFVFCEKIPEEEELIAHYSTYPRHDFISELTLKRYHELLDKLEKYRKTNRLLDIGCDTGFFLKEAAARGWEIYGTEFTDDAIRKAEAKGAKIERGALNEKMFEPGFFDVITSIEVMEHIYDLKSECQNIHRLLRTGGVLYFTTPNFDCIERFFLKDNYQIIDYPEHLSYFNAKTINYLLERNGFGKVFIKTTGISLSRISLSKARKKNIATNEPAVGPESKDEILRNKLESGFLNKFIKGSINGVLNFFKIGNSLKGLYIKK